VGHAKSHGHKKPGRTKKQSRQAATSGRPGINARWRMPFDWTLALPLAVAFVAYLGAVLIFPLPPVVRDAYAYSMSAIRLLHDHVYAYSTQLPGTPIVPNANVTPGIILFLAAFLAPVASNAGSAVGTIAGVMPWVVAAQLVLAFSIVLALTLAGRLLGGRRLGIVAGLAAALFLPFAWASTTPLAEQLGTTLFAWFLCAAIYLTGAEARRTLPRFLGFGVLGAATLMARPTLTPFVLVPFAYLAVRRVVAPLDFAKYLGIAALGFCIVFAPWWIRNERAVGSICLIRSDTTASTTYYPPAYPNAGPQGLGTIPQYPAAVANAAWVQAVTDPSPFGQLSDALTRPWVPQLADVWEDVYSPSTARIGFAEPPTYSPMTLVALQTLMGYYETLLVALSVLSVFFARRFRRIGMVLCAPPLLIAVHYYGRQFSPRYLYPAMPAFVLLAACGGLGAWMLAERIVRGTQAGDSTGPAEAKREQPAA
jgi:hypothetical protein